MAVLGVTANIVDILYYPIEKICWLSEHNIIDVKNADAWDVLDSSFWVISVYLNLMRTLRNYSLNQRKVDAVNVANSHVDEKLLKNIGWSYYPYCDCHSISHMPLAHCPRATCGAVSCQHFKWAQSVHYLQRLEFINSLQSGA
ncbi:unnamed protein product [Ceratitis capitata]|uniref:(Mediterranean fruit fly) hypothetical protein n=1 Tax=Ceratitis capitata TaxID=7213 RepID=A0A811U7R5_CERCA|nr:unnamed protein product [Ceratitis capitata]